MPMIQLHYFGWDTALPPEIPAQDCTDLGQLKQMLLGMADPATQSIFEELHFTVNHAFADDRTPLQAGDTVQVFRLALGG